MTKELLTGRDDIFLLHDFLSPEDCDALIARTEAVGFDLATVNGALGPVVHTSLRNNTRVILDDVELARRMWDKVSDLMPRKGAMAPYGLNERFRFYRYEPGQFFDWHFDGPFERDFADFSQLTFMIYLNDDCVGGSTDFHFGGVMRDETQLKVQPIRGTALVFTHKILHRGSELVAGRKYVARSDVMYRVS
jgi:hypothetical protein